MIDPANTDLERERAYRAAKEWLAVRAEDRAKVRRAITLTMRSNAPTEALPALCRLINMLDIIDPGSVPR